MSVVPRYDDPRVRRWALLVLALLVAFASNPVSATAQEPESDFFTTSDDINIRYLTLGDAGSWVVLIHGYGDSAQRMWFRTGIAQKLAENHRVVALDNRNHGQSDEPVPDGAGRPDDVIELMDHLGIQRAHIHGYSMGGGMTGSLLASNPDRFITAGFGGSGLREIDPESARRAEMLDPVEPGAETDGNPAAPRTGSALDLWSLDIPVLAINGQYDRPYSKTQRMWRELKVFENVVLPGHDHLSAIMVGGPMPQQYIDSISSFIDGYDIE